MVFNEVIMTWGFGGGTESNFCKGIDSWACTSAPNHINFHNMFASYESMVQNIVHELGHVFANIHLQKIFPDYFDRTLLRPNSDWVYQQHPCSKYPLTCKKPTEIFADMFVAWVNAVWNRADKYQSDVVNAKNYMDDLMPEFE
jgi:hypothetical protein